MFRDREKALKELNQQLLEEDDDTEETQCDEEDVDYEADYETEEDELEEIEEFYASRRKNGCSFWLLLLAAFILIVAYFLAKEGGLL